MSNFVKITKEDFQSFLSQYTIIDEPQSKELIYEIQTKIPTIKIRIYSSIDVHAGITRDIGEDAIRCVLIDIISGKPVNKAKRTHRMGNWKTRLLEKLNELQQEVEKVIICSFCGSAMVLRNTPNPFYGCLSFPSCKATSNLSGIQKVPKNQPSFNVTCPLCEGLMTKRSGRRGEFYGCTNFFKTGCRGTRQVSDVEYYDKGLEENEEPIQICLNTKSTSNFIETKKEIALVPTSEFPHLNFKFEFFNPVQSEVFTYYNQDVNCVVAAATSAGKTTVAEMFMSDSISKGKKAIFLSPLKAVSQEKYDDWTDPKHGWSKLNVSIVTGDYQLTEKRVEELNNAHVIIMTLEMIDSRTRRIAIEKNMWLLDAGTIVVDECFTKGALVRIEDNVEIPIEEVFNNSKIKYVLSYNEKTQKLEKKKIVRRIRKLFTEKLLSIKYELDGVSHSFTCTPNHRIWTKKGYIRADELKKDDVLKILPLSTIYTCQICNKNFKNKLIFLKHYGKEHIREEKHICKSCNKEFNRKNDLHHHAKVIRTKYWGSKTTKNSFVYNLEVEDNHNYIVNNVLVSNCHLLTVKGRGDKAESAIMRFTKQNPSCRVIFLSATMPNVDELARWLSSLNGKKTELINSDYRPCQLNIHYETYDDFGKYRTVEGNKIQKAIEITQQYKTDKFIVFVHAKKTGRDIYNMLKTIGEQVELHNSELTLTDRVRVTNEFKAKDGIRIIVATSTLAWGINLPARRCVVVGVHRGLQEVEPLDIKQMVGRSGRVGLDPQGDAHVLLPQRKFRRYKEWCENIPPIMSTMNDKDVLAFHIISEISEGEVYDISTLMSWYNRSLAAFQSNFLDRVDAEKLLSDLEKIKVLEKHGTKYVVTKLGKVAAYLYYSPYTIAGWYFNFNRVFSERNSVDDYKISWALANIPDNNNNFSGRDMQDFVQSFSVNCNNRGYVINESCAFIGVLIHACLNYSEEIGEHQKRQVKYDSERMCSALEMIDNMYAHWNMHTFWRQLQLRIEYEITQEQTELCKLSGIGGVRVRKLFEGGIKTILDFKRKKHLAEELLGEFLYQKVLTDNRKILA